MKVYCTTTGKMLYFGNEPKKCSEKIGCARATVTYNINKIINNKKVDKNKSRNKKYKFIITGGVSFQ